MNYIEYVFVFGTLLFIFVGFAIKCVLDVCNKPKRNRLNKEK